MTWLGWLAAEFAVTIASGEVWLSIGLALLLGGVCLLFGIWMARTVGLLEPGAPAGESLGVGLGSGVMVLATWWAAIWSGGRSSFTVVAVGFAVAIAFALVRGARLRLAVHDASETPDDRGTSIGRRSRNKPIIRAALAGGAFVVALALLYGSTMAPSPRDGLQPVEYMDEAFYAVLGRDLATTGTETNTVPSGFSDLPRVPT